VDVFAMDYAQWHGELPDRLQVGELTFIPAWQRTAAESNGCIVFDPGVVFGAGNHQTTLDCLRVLRDILHGERINRALDLGTGSGLLALAAAKLGCSRVAAVDLNPLAAQTALRNVRANHLTDRIVVCRGRAEEAAGCAAELLMANLHLEALQRIVEGPAFRRVHRFLLSGLLPSQASAIRSTLIRSGARIERIVSGDGTWHTMAGFWPAGSE
jgi:ribosomal protein L11 methyltransferase